MRLRTSRWTSSRTSSPGSATSSTARGERPRRVEDAPRCCGKTFSATSARRRGTTAAAASRRSARSRRSTHVVVAGLGVVALDLQQAEQLVHARAGPSAPRRRCGRRRARRAARPASPAPGPVALHLVLGLDLLGPQAVADRRRLGAERRARARRRASARGRWRARGCAARRPRSGARWPRRPRSCRRRPCRCRGWSGAPCGRRGYSAGRGVRPPGWRRWTARE